MAKVPLKSNCRLFESLVSPLIHADIKKARKKPEIFNVHNFKRQEHLFNLTVFPKSTVFNSYIHLEKSLCM